MPRHLIQTPILLALLLQASQAKALGFGNASGLTALGRPLAFSVNLRLEPGEQIDTACVGAEVDVGDRRLPADQVVARLVRDNATGERRIRVSTSSPIDEPSLTVTVRAGCPTRLTRGFVVFADPPHTLPQMADGSGGSDEAGDGASASQSPFGAAATTPASAPGEAAAPRRAARPARSAPAGRPPAAPRAAAVPEGATPSAEGAAGPASTPVARKAPAPVRPRAPQRPQRPVLELDAPERDEPAPSAAVPASSPASAVMPATDEAELARRAQDETRLKSLEAAVQQLLEERRAKDQTLDALQARVRAAEEARFANPVTYALGALCLLLAGAVVGLLLLRRRDQARAAWWTAEAARTAEPESLLKAEPADDWSSPAKLGDGPAPDLRPRRSAAAADVAQSAPAGNATFAAAPAPAIDSTSGADLADAGLRRPMSAEELIDLEQQVEFFVVLGQDEAAIDLLMGHVRSTSGVSPLPYLKLLEIYRRRDEREPYERIRERFNRRFNAYAPDWGVDPESGNSLEGYPDVLGQVQAVWESPADAMAVLDRLLFQREAGPTFDVPAYRELLFLYGISRDLAERDVPASGVDLLLPLGEGDSDDVKPPYPGMPAAVEPFTLSLEPQAEPPPRRPGDTPLEFDLDLNLDVSPVPPPPREDGTPSSGR